VQILDPATGTATFLNETIKFVADKFKGQEGMWPDYAKNNLIPRLHGFELMMGAYTIAHLKLGLTLKNLGVDDIGGAPRCVPHQQFRGRCIHASPICLVLAWQRPSRRRAPKPLISNLSAQSWL
jgi:hypothetical protein